MRFPNSGSWPWVEAAQFRCRQKWPGCRRASTTARMQVTPSAAAVLQRPAYRVLLLFAVVVSGVGRFLHWANPEKTASEDEELAS
jgi:hypothetical protein